jgi:antitoxin ParD1/3/4
MGMNINLTPQLEELVRSKVAFGLYTSASEVVREALRPLEGRTGLGTQSSRNCVLMLVRD